MKALQSFACVVAAVLTTGQAFSGDRGGKGREPAENLFDALLRECKLTEQQQADVKGKMKAREEALAAWDKANADKLTAAEDAGKAARTGADADAKKKAAADLKALADDREKATAEADTAILGLLTPAQQATWAGYKLYQTVSARLRKANVTDEQTAKIKAACAEAAKELAANEGDDKKAKKERTDINGKLKWAVEVVILTPEQREQLPAGRKAAGQKAPELAPAATPTPPAAPAAPATPAPEAKKPADEKK